MTCKINKSLYDMIFQLVTEKKLESIYFYPYHKGIDISTEGKMNESEKKEFEDGLADMWYDNEFIYRFTLYPQINNGVLEFEALNENDLVEFGSAREDWNFEELVKTIKIDLAEQIDCEINVDDLALNIDGSGYPSIELNNYDLKYYKAGVKKPIVLSKNEEIKSKIINYVEHWAVNNLFNCSKDDINYRIDISDSSLMHLYESWSTKMDIEIVEN